MIYAVANETWTLEYLALIKGRKDFPKGALKNSETTQEVVGTWGMEKWLWVADYKQCSHTGWTEQQLAPKLQLETPCHLSPHKRNAIVLY